MIEEQDFNLDSVLKEWAGRNDYAVEELSDKEELR